MKVKGSTHMEHPVKLLHLGQSGFSKAKIASVRPKSQSQPWSECKEEGLRKEKTTPFDIDISKSLVTYQAA